jgi:hypothetical protein
MLRRRKVAAYIDGTFRCTPKPFVQLLILTVYDDETELYVPIVYCLVEDKMEWTYWHFVHLVLIATDLKFDPATITSDFERPLFKAIKDQLPNATRIGCFFHFTQAIRRKMTSLHIPDDQISEFMRRETLDKLTLKTRPEVLELLAELKKTFYAPQQSQKWLNFFAYFHRTWLKDIDFDLWNLSTALNNGVTIENRTNNGLENYNKQLNDTFATSHPNLFHFVDVIKESSCRTLRLIRETKDKNSRPPTRLSQIKRAYND